MNSNKAFVGAILGFNRKKGYYSSTVKFIGKVSEVGDKYLCTIYQGSEGKANMNVYESTQIIQLPLTEELLDNTEFFMKNDDSWASPNSSVIISKNSDSSNRKWNVKFLDEKRNVISIANFNYIDELQAYANLAEIELDIKFGTIRTLYQDYIENV